MKLNILGTEYEFVITTEREDATLYDKGGYCDPYGKRIAIECDYCENHPDCIKDFEAYLKHVIRHEIVHAYLYSSGLSGYAENEQLVDWIAAQFPKMLETFTETNAL